MAAASKALTEAPEKQAYTKTLPSPLRRSPRLAKGSAEVGPIQPLQLPSIEILTKKVF